MLFRSHMTTGRINQVTTFPDPRSVKSMASHSHRHHLLSERGVHQVVNCLDTSAQSMLKCVSEPNCLDSRSHISWTRSPSCNKQLGSRSSEGTTNSQSSECDNTAVVDSQVSSCERFGHWQVIHILQQCKLPSGSLT